MTQVENYDPVHEAANRVFVAFKQCVRCHIQFVEAFFEEKKNFALLQFK